MAYSRLLKVASPVTFTVFGTAKACSMHKRFRILTTVYLMAAANAADPKTERKTEAERPAVSLGRVGPSRAEWGRLGLSGVGEGLGMHWDSIKLL